MNETEMYWDKLVDKLDGILRDFNDKNVIYEDSFSFRKIKLDHETFSFTFLKIYCWGIFYYDFKIKIEYFSKRALISIRHKNVDYLDLNIQVYDFIRTTFPDFKIDSLKYSKK